MGRYNINGTTVLVTGVDGFLGSYIRKSLVDEGVTVIGVDIKSSKTASKLDVSREEEVEDLVADLASQNIELDGLVNNAAVELKGYNTSEEKFDEIMQVNLKGVNNCTNKFMSIMKTGSSIVNVASVYGVIGVNPQVYDYDRARFTSPGYGATKAGVIHLTKYYAALYTRNVRVNAVSPGGIWQNHDDGFHQRYSSRVPMDRMAQVDEIVQPILFLLSPLSSYINGHNLVVDGGMSIW